jgi:hypothetical protein
MSPEEGVMVDLVERLQHAVAQALANQRPDLERHPEQIRGVTLELRLRSNGQRTPSIEEATCYLERRLSSKKLVRE